MRRSTDRIITSHAGSLPRPPELLEQNRAKQRGEPVDTARRAQLVRDGVRDVVRQQIEVGLDSINDGEFSKTVFLDYIDRMSGFQQQTYTGSPIYRRRNMIEFEDFFKELYPGRGGIGMQPTCVGPVSYVGQALIQTDIDNFKAALEGQQYEEGFLPAIAPGTFGRGVNQYYKTEEEFLFAIGEAMHEEYKAVIDAGFVLQLDDPGLPDTWDAIIPEPSIEEYRKFAQMRIEALNHGLRGLPEDMIRYHICWGSWHGPHTNDIPLEDIVDLMLMVNAGCYSLEAANARHEHEWRVWEGKRLPEGKMLMPGVVSHATNVVEHPRLVADRLIRYAGLVGKENVIAGTDCGMGGRVHPSIAWAKFRALREGADLATKELW
ncbi:MAG TPA: cobalamin-independent methionine synthase II family protein [Dehalococcoidia bacterium]|jgi:5-methyltetrahydropteroyltriglutamate--homocysteine methyltransferase|nr:cobalamin-independent methionine synthase II family protein [Dehalococcoidia bacterium]